MQETESSVASALADAVAVAPAVPAVTLSAPGGYRLPDLGGVAAGVTVGPVEERPLTTVLWDTADLRLARWGCSLRYRAGEGWTVVLPRPDGDGPTSHEVRRVAGEEGAVPAAALDLVAAVARTAPLAPRAEVQTVRRVTGVRDAAGRVLVEVDDHVPLSSASTSAEGDAAAREIEVAAGADSPPELLPAVVDRLVEAGASGREAAAGVVPALGAAAAAEVVAERLRRSSSAAAVVRRAVAAATLRLIRHDPWIRVGGDPEAVHQARVAVRRLRSDLRTFAPLLVPTWADALRDELRWIGGELGQVRDAEVLAEGLGKVVAELPAADVPAGRRLVADLAGDIDVGRDRLIEALRSSRYLELLERLVEASRAPMLLPQAEAAARSVLPGLVRRPWAKLRRDARRLDRGSSDEELHALRIRAKRCRYAAEASAPVLGRRASGFARRVARLQEVLGEHHDAVVAAARLHQRAPGSSHAFVAGQVWGLEQVAAQSARRSWPKAWRAARRRRLRSWM